jgi:4-amino-4-deoxy-L-arabinose transferase-like glycosyltransferase
VLSLLRRRLAGFSWDRSGWVGAATLLFFYFPAVTDDSRVYADFATNWLQHGVYGVTQSNNVVPTDERLPGYPGFLAVLFALFGPSNFRAVMLVQILIDLGTCLIIADLARRTVSDRAANVAFALAALCPFLANYAAAVLTETLEVFFTVVALDCAAAGLDRINERQFHWQAWAGSGFAIAACILLRPDGGILLAAVGVYLMFLTARHTRQNSTLGPAMTAAFVVSLCALAPLVPWTIRNFRTLHHFQPLAPRYATAQDELSTRGFNRWVRTWIVDYASVEEIYWNVPGDNRSQQTASRAFDSPSQRDATLALINDYNQSSEYRPISTRFSKLAAQQSVSIPFYYVELPALRIADMWMRPRTELLPSDVSWWEFNDDLKGSILAVSLGLINLSYIAAALLGATRRLSGIRYAGLLLGFILLRSAFLGTLESPEPRYTLECYPIVMVLAAQLLFDWRSRLSSGTRLHRVTSRF